MRKYHPGGGLVGLAVVLGILLMGVGKTYKNPTGVELVYATGSHVAIAYGVVGVGLLVLARVSETPRVTFRAGALIGMVAIGAVYVARRVHPAVGSNMGSDPAIFYVAVISVLVFVVYTARHSPRIVVALIVTALVTVVPPLVRARECNARLAETTGHVDGAPGCGIFTLLYAIAFGAGVLYGLPFVLTGKQLEKRTGRSREDIR